MNRRARSGAGLLSALLLAGGCTSDSSSTHAADDDRAAVLAVMEEARSALLEGDATEVCSFLTSPGIQDVMEFRVYFDRGGKIEANDPRLPQTCKSMVHRLYLGARSADSGTDWPSQLAAGRFTVARISGDQATVRLKVPEPYGAVVTFELVRGRAGWLIDDSDGVPSGH